MLDALIFCTLAVVSCTTPVEREVKVTAYTLSPEETDADFCHGATGEDLCKALADGEMLCAANFVPLGTTLTVEGFGACRVADRLNKRYPNRVDILVKDKQTARQWGIRIKKVKYNL